MKAVLMSLMLSAVPAMADTVKIPLGQQGEATLETPQRGASMASVMKQFGAPEAQRGPVGEPAIYIWQYPAFNVYFENKYVIHSVLQPDTAKDS